MIFSEMNFHNVYNFETKYRTRAIITRSRFETALDYKPLCNINRG